MTLNKEDITQALTTGGGVARGDVRNVATCDGYVTVTLVCEQNQGLRGQMLAQAERAVHGLAEKSGEAIKKLEIEFALPAKAAAPVDAHGDGPGSIPGVRHIIAVGAGKGGVGKSTLALNLAVALARTGSAVGLLDGDIYGPSVPTLMGLDGLETIVHENRLQPFFEHGVKAMTIGKLVDPEKALIWRGPMAHGAFKQLVDQTQWGELDYLIIDLPPGTGDVPLTMAQTLSLRGAVIVCTPQKVAQDDAVRAARMFEQLNIEVLGVVENMSYFVGDDGKEYDLFGRGGAEQMASRLGLPFLGAVPISMALRQNSDGGNPTANFDGVDSALRESLEKLAVRVEDEVARAAMAAGDGPVLKVS